MNKSPYDVVLHPLLTEKSSFQKGFRQFSFAVSSESNKIEIQQSIEKIFEVSVEVVRTQNVRGKIKRFGRNFGKRPNWKKAIVTLKEGSSIELFDAEMAD